MRREVRRASPSDSVGGGVPGAPILGGMQDDTAPAGDRERVQAELVNAEGVSPDGIAADADGAAAADEDVQEQITSPTKLIRIASMVRSMLDEVRRAPLDDAGRRRLREIHEKSLEELEGVLSPDLRQELSEVVLPFTSDTPDRVGAAPRAGAARRVARGPLPRHPGHAVHPAGHGPGPARRDAPPACARPRCRRPGRSERVPVSGPTGRRRRRRAGSGRTDRRVDPHLVARSTTPRSSPTGPIPPSSTRRSTSCARCRRSSSPARLATSPTRSPRCTTGAASCCRPATARSRSTRSAPTRSATS